MRVVGLDTQRQGEGGVRKEGICSKQRAGRWEGQAQPHLQFRTELGPRCIRIDAAAAARNAVQLLRVAPDLDDALLQLLVALQDVHAGWRYCSACGDACLWRGQLRGDPGVSPCCSIWLSSSCSLSC